MQHQLCSGAFFKHLGGMRFRMVKVGSKNELDDGKWVAGSGVSEW